MLKRLTCIKIELVVSPTIVEGGGIIMLHTYIQCAAIDNIYPYIIHGATVAEKPINKISIK